MTPERLMRALNSIPTDLRLGRPYLGNASDVQDLLFAGAEILVRHDRESLCNMLDGFREAGRVEGMPPDCGSRKPLVH